MSMVNLSESPIDSTVPITAASPLRATIGNAVPPTIPTAKRRSSLGLPRKFCSAGALHLALTAIAFLMVTPFVWMVLTSLKPADEVDSPNWLPQGKLITHADGTRTEGPINFQWHNYAAVFDAPTPQHPEAKGIAFGRYYWNSIFVAAWVTFLQVVTSAMAAFSFSRLKWPGRDKVFLAYLSTMMLPSLVMTIPNFKIMISLRLVDTLPGLIIPSAFSAFGTFLLRQFMLTIPSALDEAAEIDGAGKVRLFFDIILPLARPGLITLTIFTFMGTYNSLFWPLVMLSSQSKYTLPLGLLSFDSSQGNATHLLMAAVTMSVLPMILLFLFLQRYLVKGIQLGAVKG